MAANSRETSTGRLCMKKSTANGKLFNRISHADDKESKTKPNLKVGLHIRCAQYKTVDNHISFKNYDMQSITFFWIAVIVIGLIGIIGKLIRKESFDLKGESVFHRMYIFGCFMIFILLASITGRYDYRKESAEDNREKYHIPCIDSSMELIRRQKNEEVWRNSIPLRLDSIQHYKKVITIDRLGIFKETDYFVNLYENRTLILETVLPDFLRKQKIKYRLVNDFDFMDRYAGTKKMDLDSLQTDSVLVAWGLTLNYDCNKNR